MCVSPKPDDITTAPFDAHLGRDAHGVDSGLARDGDEGDVGHDGRVLQPRHGRQALHGLPLRVHRDDLCRRSRTRACSAAAGRRSSRRRRRHRRRRRTPGGGSSRACSRRASLGRPFLGEAGDQHAVVAVGTELHGGPVTRRRARRRAPGPSRPVPRRARPGPGDTGPSSSRAVTWTRVTATQSPPPAAGRSRELVGTAHRAVRTREVPVVATASRRSSREAPATPAVQSLRRSITAARLQDDADVRREHATVGVHVARPRSRPPGSRRARGAAGRRPRRGGPCRPRHRSARRTAGRRGCSSGSGRPPRRHPPAHRPRPGRAVSGPSSSSSIATVIEKLS